uniref:Uncharacterized protein n=1 Tax=Anguilla anguilla TaxID=7936 RepID=A0A0E9TUL0_ANGAN
MWPNLLQCQCKFMHVHAIKQLKVVDNVFYGEAESCSSFHIC